MSRLRTNFENNKYENCFLLGDGDYPCRNYLITPLLNSMINEEKKYQVFNFSFADSKIKLIFFSL